MSYIKLRTTMIILCCISFCSQLTAAEKWFQAYVDNDWSNSSNWDGGLPAHGDSVLIVAVCTLDMDLKINLESFRVSATGSIFLTEHDTINLINTAQYNNYAAILGSNNTNVIDGVLSVESSVVSGIDLRNTIINGSVSISGVQVGVPVQLGNVEINGELILGVNPTSALFSIYVIGNATIENGAIVQLSNPSKVGVMIDASGQLTLNEAIHFPPNQQNTFFETKTFSSKLINNDTLEFNHEVSDFHLALFNNGTFTNNGYIHFPVNGNVIWRENGTFINNPCGYILLDGLLSCTDFTTPITSASITNKGIIYSPANDGFNHIYSGSHTFNNVEGIIADPASRFSSPLDFNSGIKTKLLDFSTCVVGELINIYDGSLMNIGLDDFYLDTLLTVAAANYNNGNNSVNLLNNAAFQQKFYTKITDSDHSCEIIIPVLIDDFLDLKVFFLDLDEDGYGETTDTLVSCSFSITGRTTTPGDCDDENPTIHPGAKEFCDGIDSDCDGNGSMESVTSISFTGLYNNNWYDPANWDSNQIPNYCSDVIIPSGKIATLSTIQDTIASLMIEENATLNLDTSLQIFVVENTGITNDGILYGPHDEIFIQAAEEGDALVNNDSMFVNRLTIRNMPTGIQNYGSMRLYNLEMQNIELTPIYNEGTLLFDSDPPNQNFISFSEILSYEVIYNEGELIFNQAFFGGNEKSEEEPGGLFIENTGTMRVHDFFDFYPSDPDYRAIYCRGTLIIDSNVSLYGDIPLDIAGPEDGNPGGNLILESGGDLNIGN